MNKMFSLLQLLALVIYIVNGEITSLLNAPSGAQCISIKFREEIVYLVHNGGDRVSLSTTCSAKWTVSDYKPNNRQDPDGVCTGSSCKLIKAENSRFYLTDIPDSGRLEASNGRGAWFVLRDNSFIGDGQYQIFNMHLDSVNKNPLLCATLTQQGHRLYFERANVGFCGWNMNRNGFAAMAPVNNRRLLNMEMTSMDTLSDNKEITSLTTIIGSNSAVCISTVNPIAERVYLAHNGGDRLSLSTTCSSKWTVRFYIPGNSRDPDRLCTAGAQCVLIQAENSRFYLTDIADRARLEASNGRGAWYQIRNSEFGLPQLLNVHLNSIRQDPLLCSQVRSGNSLYYERLSTTDCTWRFD